MLQPDLVYLVCVEVFDTLDLGFVLGDKDGFIDLHSSKCRYLVRPMPFIEDAFFFPLYGFGFFMKIKYLWTGGA